MEPVYILKLRIVFFTMLLYIYYINMLHLSI